jgi:hypothetical protein
MFILPLNKLQQSASTESWQVPFVLIYPFPSKGTMKIFTNPHVHNVIAVLETSQPNIPSRYHASIANGPFTVTSLFSIAIGYGLDGFGRNPGRGETFHTSPDRPLGPPSHLYNGYRIFPGVNSVCLQWQVTRRPLPSPWLLPLVTTNPTQGMGSKHAFLCTRSVMRM